MEFKFSFSRGAKKEQSFNTATTVLNKAFWTDFFSKTNGKKTIEQLKNEAYGENPYAYMVISKIAQTISRLSFEMMIGEKPINSGKIYDLWQRPNPSQYTTEFVEASIVELLTAGEIIIAQRVPVGYTTVEQLDVLKAQYVTIITDSWNNIVRYDYNYNNQIEQLTPDKILHIKLYNPLYNDDRALRGMSPLSVLDRVTSASNSNFNAEASILENRGISGFISSNDASMPLMEKDKQALQSAYDKKNNGSDKFGKIKVVGSDVKFTQVGASSTDLQLLDSNVSKLRVISALFGLSSQLFGDSASTTFNNMEEANKSAYLNCYIPMATFFTDQLNKWIEDTLKGKEKIVINKDKIEALAIVDKTLSDKIVNEVKAGILSASQALNILYPNLIFDESAKPQQGGAQNA